MIIILWLWYIYYGCIYLLWVFNKLSWCLRATWLNPQVFWVSRVVFGLMDPYKKQGKTFVLRKNGLRGGFFLGFYFVKMRSHAFTARVRIEIGELQLSVIFPARGLKAVLCVYCGSCASRLSLSYPSRMSRCRRSLFLPAKRSIWLDSQSAPVDVSGIVFPPSLSRSLSFALLQQPLGAQ